MALESESLLTYSLDPDKIVINPGWGEIALKTRTDFNPEPLLLAGKFIEESTDALRSFEYILTSWIQETPSHREFSSFFAESDIRYKKKSARERYIKELNTLVNYNVIVDAISFISSNMTSMEIDYDEVVRNEYNLGKVWTYRKEDGEVNKRRAREGLLLFSMYIGEIDKSIVIGNQIIQKLTDDIKSGNESRFTSVIPFFFEFSRDRKQYHSEYVQ